jgi:hypothetical protein
MQIPELTAQQALLLVHNIETKGLACIPNYLSLADLGQMQQSVNGAIAETEKNTLQGTQRCSRFWPGRAYNALARS